MKKGHTLKDEINPSVSLPLRETKAFSERESLLLIEANDNSGWR
jgi:hypothetical protein